MAEIPLEDSNYFKEQTKLVAGTQTQTIPCGDRVTPIEAPTNSVGIWHIPYGTKLLGFVGFLEFPTTGTFTVDALKNGESILSTKIIFEDGQKSSLVSADQPVLSEDTAGAQALIRFDVLDEGGGTAAGLRIQPIYQLDSTIAAEPPPESSEPPAALFVGESSASPNTDGTYTLTGTHNGKPYWNKSGGDAGTSAISWSGTAWQMFFAWSAEAWTLVGYTGDLPVGHWGTLEFPTSGPEVTVAP